MISGVFARTFRSAVQPVEIASALNREVDNSAQILSRDRRLVPNNFHVELSEADHERLEGLGPQLPRELTEMLREHAAQQSYVFTGPVSIALEASDDLTTGRFRVRSKAIAERRAWPAATPPTPRYDEPPRPSSSTASSLPLAPPGIVIGRGNDADLRIDDPGVSRKHIEIRVEEPQDLDGGPASPCTTSAPPTGSRSTASASRRPRSPTVRRSGSATRPCPCTSNKGELRLVRADPRADPLRLPGDPVDLRALLHLGDPLRHVRRPGRPPGRRAAGRPGRSVGPKAKRRSRPSRAAAYPPRS